MALSTAVLDFNPIQEHNPITLLIEGRHLEASDGGAGCGVPRKHAPGRHRDPVWRPIRAARQELADGRPFTLERPTKSTARCRKENARKSARTARACPGGAPSGAPVFSRGNTGTQDKWLRHLARHPLHILRGERNETGDRPTRGLDKEYG